LQDGEFIFFMIKGVLTHHPIHPILSNVQQKVNYLKTFSHFLPLVPVDPVTSYIVFCIFSFAGCGRGTITTTIHSSPDGADIYHGPSPGELTRMYATTPHTLSFTTLGPYWKAWYYQGKKEGYYDSDIVFKDGEHGNRFVFLTLKPIEYSDIEQKYELSVMNIDNEPVIDAVMEYSVISSDDKLLKNKTVISTNPKGIILISVKVGVSGDSPRPTYKTTLDYKITKNGYLPKGGKIEFKSRAAEVIHQSIILDSLLDYIDKSLLSKEELKVLQPNIENLINALLARGFLSSAVLEKKSIRFEQFKNKTYFNLSFNSANVYNSIKFDKYDIGKQLFDEVVRKILYPLDTFLNNSPFFQGYSIEIDGHTKNFVTEKEVKKDIKYKFYIPKDIANKYISKDISGQKILNNSIILMDNERIELKLQ